MEIFKIQQEVKVALKPVQHPRIGTLLALQEEIGELTKVITNWELYGEQDRKNLQAECADVLLGLMDVANAYDVDLDIAAKEKFQHMLKEIPAWKEKYATRLERLREQFDRPLDSPGRVR